MNRANAARTGAARIGRIYVWFLVILAVTAPLAHYLAILIVSIPALIGVVLVAGALLLMRFNRLAGSLFLALIFLSVASFFVFADLRYTTTHSNIGGWPEAVGSALDNNIFSHLALMIGLAHVGLALSALIRR